MLSSRQVLGQVLGHALGERGHQRALSLGRARLDLLEQVVDLPLGGAHLDHRVEQPRRADDLLDHLFGMLALS